MAASAEIINVAPVAEIIIPCVTTCHPCTFSQPSRRKLESKGSPLAARVCVVRHWRRHVDVVHFVRCALCRDYAYVPWRFYLLLCCYAVLLCSAAAALRCSLQLLCSA